MGPIAYNLCQKPVIGVVMWITTLCSFPPLFSNEPIALNVTGAIASKAFSVPVDKTYPLAITFEFPTLQSRLDDQIVGSKFDANCNEAVPYEQIPEGKRVGLGRPIPFKVIVRSAKGQTVITEKTFNSLCITSHNGATKKTRTIGRLELQRGEYTIEVTNVQAQLGMEGVKTQVSLYGGEGK